MSWNRIGSQLSFSVGMLALFGLLIFCLYLFFFPVYENPYSSEAREIGLQGGVPFLIGLVVALIALMPLGLQRVTASDSELCQFCVKDLDNFADSLRLYLVCGQRSRSLYLRDSANQHLKSAVGFSNRVVNRQRRDRIISHAGAVGCALRASLVGDSGSLDPNIERKLLAYAQWLPAESFLAEELGRGLKVLLGGGHSMDT